MLAGCAQPSVPQDRYYRITAPAASGGGTLLPGTVEVERFGAEGLTSGRAIIYVENGAPDTLLEYSGWPVVSIPFYEWGALKSLEEEKAYLTEKVMAVVLREKEENTAPSGKGRGKAVFIGGGGQDRDRT